jgi:NleD-like pathogen effector protein (putative zinc metallopeptidase)
MMIKEPKKPLPAGYRPTGGIARKVVEGDSWLRLAASAGVDPWWLIQYNFETRDPAEVNWYLKNRVGCDKVTADKKNFRFSASASPGMIYLPSPQIVRSLKNQDFKLYGIVIEGDEDYRKEVATTLSWLARADTGMVLLKAIQRTGKEIVISPWVGTECNATANFTSVRDATAPGEVVLKGGSSFEQLMEPSMVRDLLGLPHEPMMGTGKGSNGQVKFSPSMFGYGVTGACAAFAGAPGASPSQVLFHELAHAYRIANGAFHPRPTIAGSAGYTNMEEFFAVVLSNILISDPTYNSGNRTLRADHSGFVPLTPTLSTSHGFMAHSPNSNKVRELIAGDPALASELKAVKSSFNPFATAP